MTVRQSTYWLFVMSTERKYGIVLIGATGAWVRAHWLNLSCLPRAVRFVPGFTGQLIAQYLRQRVSGAWAIAGAYFQS